MAVNRFVSAGARGRRSAYLAEFYNGRDAPPERKDSRPDTAKFALRRRRRKRVPVWILAASLGLVFCLIAIAGSSAIIWLRALGNVFDVRWSGD